MANHDLTATTGNAARRAMMWNAANFAVSQVASAAVFFILAAKLPPAVFGVFALALVLTDFFGLQGRSAMTDSLVQQRDFSAPALNAAFWCGLSIATFVFLIALLGGRAISDAFSEPMLAEVLPAMAATLLLVPAIAVMEALVLRDLDFKTISLRNMASVLAGGAVGLAVVFSPIAPWALVAQRVTQSVVSVAFLWATTRWAPGLAPEFAKITQFAKRTAQFWGVQTLAVAATRITEAIIGLKFGAADLGVVRVAGRFFEILHGSLTAAIMSLWVPILAKIRNDADAPERFFLRMMAIAAMLCVPAQLGLGMIGPELTRTFLAPDYAFASTFLIIVGLNAFVIPLAFFRGSILTAMGRGRTAIILGVCETIVTTSALLVFVPFGLAACISAQIAASIGFSLISGVATARAVNVRMVDFITAIRPAYEGCIGMMALLWLTAPLFANAPGPIAMAALVIAGAAGYALVIALFHRDWALANINFLRARGQDN